MKKNGNVHKPNVYFSGLEGPPPWLGARSKKFLNLKFLDWLKMHFPINFISQIYHYKIFMRNLSYDKNILCWKNPENFWIPLKIQNSGNIWKSFIYVIILGIKLEKVGSLMKCPFEKFVQQKKMLYRWNLVGPPLIFRSPLKLFFCLGSPSFFCPKIFRPPPPLKIGGGGGLTPCLL